MSKYSKWYWLSFCDSAGKFMGVMVIFALDPEKALACAERAGVDPKWEVDGREVDHEWGMPPMLAGDRIVPATLLTKEEAAQLAKRWDPERRGLADAGQLNDQRDPVAGGPEMKRPE